MLTLKTPIITAPFKEQPTADPSTANEFDIVIQESQSVVELEVPGLCESKPCESKGEGFLKLYCETLLIKILTLNKSKIKPFIRYQVEMLSDPFIWLNKLEKLIDLNREQFTTKDHNCKLDKALIVIEVFRQEIESGKFSNSKFNFKKVKQTIQRYQTPEEKMSYLLEVKTDFLQNKPITQDPTEVPFDIQCDLELNLLKTKRKLIKKKKATPLSVGEGSGVRLKLQINSKLNTFVDIFYQLMYEKQINGKPYLSATPTEVAEIISKTFIDKDGNEISKDTIKTILKPSRIEKRPKDGARIKLT